MKRLREDENDDNESLSCICSGLFLHQDTPQDKVCMIMTVMNGRKLTNYLYCLLLDEYSSVLLSPLIIHNIIIEPLTINTHVKPLNYFIYKLKSILPYESNNHNRLCNKNNKLLKNSDIKLIIQNTFYLYSIVFKSPLESNISEFQRKILNNIFLKSQPPIIDYKYEGNAFLIKLITTLFHITQNQEPQSKKQKTEESGSNEESKDEDDITVISKTSPGDLWITLHLRNSIIGQFFDGKFYDYEKKKQKVIYEQEEEVLTEFKKWRESGINVVYYRFNNYKYESTINSLIGNKLNEFGGLSYFNDNQLTKIYRILQRSIKYYHDNSNFKLTDTSILIDNQDIKELNHYVIKKINILHIVIDIIRELFYQDKKDEKEEDSNIIINLFLDNFIYNLTKHCNTDILKNGKTISIVKYNTLLYIVDQFFFKKFDDDNKILINGYKPIYLNQFLLLVFKKLPTTFKVNKEYETLFSPDNIPTPYTEVLCYYDINDNNYKLEELNFTINKHNNIFHSSFVSTSIEKFAPLILENTHKRFSIDYLCTTKQELVINKDLKSIESIINDNYNNFTIICQNINYSMKRSSKFIDELIKLKESKLNQQINKDKQFIMSEFDEEIFDPDDEDDDKIDVSLPESTMIQNVKNINSINKDRMKLLIIIDCHQLDIIEWHKLYAWIIKYLKSSIRNVIFIGCPFMGNNKSIGQPFIDSLFQINELATKSLLYNKMNIISNKQVQEDTDVNKQWFKKDSFTTLSLLENVFN